MILYEALTDQQPFVFTTIRELYQQIIKVEVPPLRKLAPERDELARLDVRTVIDVVARFFQTTPEAMASRSRRRDVLLPRQLAMYLCRRYTDASHGTIGHAFGRDHPSVRNAVVVIERRILERAPLRYRVEALCSRLEELQLQRAE